MNGNKYDNFSERLSTQANAKSAALTKFRARPAPDDPAVLERQAAQAAIAAAREARIAERKAAREAEAARVLAEQKALAAEKAAREAEGSSKAAALAAQQKAARDKRYAARNARRR